jgi:6-phospho-3-hexuloisomerase
MDEIRARVLDEVKQALAAIDEAQERGFVEAIAAAREVFITGRGRSGLIGAAFATRLVHLGRRAHVVGEPTMPAISSGDVLIVCSGSGRTRGSLLNAEQAIEAGARVWAVTQDPASPLAAAAGHVVRIPPVASSQPGASAFEQALLLFLDGVVVRLMARLGETEQSMLARHSRLE